MAASRVARLSGLTTSIFQRREILDSRHGRQGTRIVPQRQLQVRELVAELGAVSGGFEGLGQRELVPFGGKRTDNLVQHWNGNLREFAGPGTMLPQNLAGQWEQLVYAVQRGLLVPGIG
jgi:hypothetical protein